MGILEITLKGRSFALEISTFDPLYYRQSFSNLDCHFYSRALFHSPHVGKPSTHQLNNTTTIGFP